MLDKTLYETLLEQAAASMAADKDLSEEYTIQPMQVDGRSMRELDLAFYGRAANGWIDKYARCYFTDPEKRRKIIAETLEISSSNVCEELSRCQSNGILGGTSVIAARCTGWSTSARRGLANGPALPSLASNKTRDVRLLQCGD